MPMPVPKRGESRGDFISRFMGDEVMAKDFPDRSQRYAICLKKWKEGRSRMMANNSRVVFEGGR